MKDSHRIPDPKSSQYAGVLSRESIRIVHTHADMHRTPTWEANIRNVCLQAQPPEKYCIVCGDAFGLENVGKKALVTRVLYGGKCAGRKFLHHLRTWLHGIFRSQVL